jgi:plasmid stabilization system protein ParE
VASLILSPEAAADLEEIVEFIASDSVDAAIRVLAEIREAMESGTACSPMGEGGGPPP